MSLLVKTAAGILHSDIDALLKVLQNGDGMGWPGDPRMYIGIGVITMPGGRTARRYEVYRYNEDGSDTFISGWKIEEKDKIIFDLVRMRADSPGHVSSAEEVAKHNAALQDEAARQYMDAAGELMKHAASVASERTNGKDTFRQVGGLRDMPKKLILPGKD